MGSARPRKLAFPFRSANVSSGRAGFPASPSGREGCRGTNPRTRKAFVPFFRREGFSTDAFWQRDYRLRSIYSTTEPSSPRKRIAQLTSSALTTPV